MRHSRSLINSVVLAGLLLLIFTHNAHAYLDPGTGSYILQLVIASLLGISFAIKVYWGKIKTFFPKRFAEGQRKEQNEQDSNK